MLEEEELKSAILVVLANKQDIEGAMSVTEASMSLNACVKITGPMLCEIGAKRRLSRNPGSALSPCTTGDTI